MEQRRSRDLLARGGDLLARLVVLASLVVAGFLVAYILLVFFKATPSNGIVTFVRHVANPLAGPFKTLFQNPKTLRVRVLVNYGLAAVVYLVAARIIARVLRVGQSSS